LSKDKIRISFTSSIEYGALLTSVSRNSGTNHEKEKIVIGRTTDELDSIFVILGKTEYFYGICDTHECIEVDRHVIVLPPTKFV